MPILWNTSNEMGTLHHMQKDAIEHSRQKEWLDTHDIERSDTHDHIRTTNWYKPTEGTRITKAKRFSSDETNQKIS